MIKFLSKLKKFGSMKNQGYQQSRQFWRPPSSIRINKNCQQTHGVESKLCQYILQNGQKDNPQDVIQKINEFCLKQWMMNIGPEKTNIIKHILKKTKANKVLEIGGYCGYSSIVFANQIKQNKGSKVVSVQINEDFATIAKKIQEHAGLSQLIDIRIGTVQSCLQKIQQYGPYDLVLLDHQKQAYSSDYKLLEDSGVLKKGSVIVGDNIIYPGAPQYLQSMKNNEEYEHTLYHTYDAYSDIPDAMLASIKK